MPVYLKIKTEEKLDRYYVKLLGYMITFFLNIPPRYTKQFKIHVNEQYQVWSSEAQQYQDVHYIVQTVHHYPMWPDVCR